jgi:CRISPR system Cascade subunit CasB
MTRDQESEFRNTCWSWWESLQKREAKGLKGDPGALARLRRGGLYEAALEEKTGTLYRRLAKFGSVKSETEKQRRFALAALIAAVLAHVRDDDNKSVARAAGDDGETPAVVHPLRFRRLMATRGDEDCLVAFRRLVALLGHRANVGDLALALFEWNVEDAGDRRRTRWAFDYYGAGAAAPDKSQENGDAGEQDAA